MSHLHSYVKFALQIVLVIIAHLAYLKAQIIKYST